ncbi:TetR family transcriptional regulator [Stenotrophomonas mori]|uniref:TetR family transcriptional regulator n=1 Tax=Stenotrophomonas mori TaxID=2871096 RepID=A0ABT0SG56_9GAMM|nr:TetR family transcriptional regulator [Stenotrophomonas mori]MCL7714310.1 TetR family transcriptional regulator [Stenotrophomonas mori]
MTDNQSYAWVMSKRDTIIDAALAVFGEKGVEKTTVSDIVKRAGIAQGTFYLYFPSRLAVMGGIAEQVLARLLRRLQEALGALPPAAQLDGLVGTVFAEVAAQHQVVALLYSGMTQTEEMRRWEQIYAPLYDWLEAVLENARAEGTIAAGVRPRHAARVLVGAIEAAAEQVYLYAATSADEAQAHRAELERFIHAGLGRTGNP